MEEPTQRNPPRGEDYLFREEITVTLSTRDGDLLLALLADPPPANDALKRLANKSKGDS